MLPKKHKSGSEKRKKKTLENKFIETQKGAMHKFVSRNVVAANSEEWERDLGRETWRGGEFKRD